MSWLADEYRRILGKGAPKPEKPVENSITELLLSGAISLSQARVLAMEHLDELHGELADLANVARDLQHHDLAQQLDNLGRRIFG